MFNFLFNNHIGNAVSWIAVSLCKCFMVEASALSVQSIRFSRISRYGILSMFLALVCVFHLSHIAECFRQANILRLRFALRKSDDFL